MEFANEVLKLFQIEGTPLVLCIELVKMLLEGLEKTVWKSVGLDENFRSLCEGYMKVSVILRLQLLGARYPKPNEIGDLLFGGGLKNLEQKTCQLFETLSYGKPINEDFLSSDF